MLNRRRIVSLEVSCGFQILVEPPAGSLREWSFRKVLICERFFGVTDKFVSDVGRDFATVWQSVNVFVRCWADFHSVRRLNLFQKFFAVDPQRLSLLSGSLKSMIAGHNQQLSWAGVFCTKMFNLCVGVAPMFGKPDADSMVFLPSLFCDGGLESVIDDRGSVTDIFGQQLFQQHMQLMSAVFEHSGRVAGSGKPGGVHQVVAIDQ